MDGVYCWSATLVMGVKEKEKEKDLVVRGKV